MNPPFDRTGLWTRMRFLLESLNTSLDNDRFIEEGLDLVVELLGARRGTLCVRSSEGEWRALVSRKQRRSVETATVDEFRRALFDQALRKRRCVVEEGHRPGDPGTRRTYIAVPLRRGAWGGANRGPRTLGALLLEIGGGRSNVDPLHIEFLDAAAVLLSMTLDQQARLEAMAEQVRMSRSHESIDGGPDLDEIMDWPSMAPLRRDVEACIVGESSVMILGESGTGKTRLATALARASHRVPIVRATLGASDDLNTITSELFGHERGAFSGAVTKRTGLVEYADGGTLILDEVLNLPPHAQQLLLDFTQFGTYRPLGYQGKEPKRADVRIISATNGNMRQAIVDTRFRQDLYFRLAGVTLLLPPLRARRAEIPDLALRYLKRLDPGRGWTLSASARRLLLSERWEWEGNIRELHALIRRARDRAIAAGLEGGAIEASHIGSPHGGGYSPSRGAPTPIPLETGREAEPTDNIEEGRDPRAQWQELQRERSRLDDMERRVIEQAMIANRGVVAHAARDLGVSRTSLLSRMATLRMDKNRYRR